MDLTYRKPDHANIMAAVMAYTNLGFSRNDLDRDTFRHMFFSTRYFSIDSAVASIFQIKIENEGMMDTFIEEAQSWISRVEDPNALASNYKAVWEWYQAMLLAKRWKHAHFADNGASNQRLLSRALHEAIVECQEENVSSNEDAAVQILLHQLAHVFGQSTTLSLDLYRKYTDCIAAHYNE